MFNKQKEKIEKFGQTQCYLVPSSVNEMGETFDMYIILNVFLNGLQQAHVMLPDGLSIWWEIRGAFYKITGGQIISTQIQYINGLIRSLMGLAVAVSLQAGSPPIFLNFP